MAGVVYTDGKMPPFSTEFELWSGARSVADLIVRGEKNRAGF
jgi:hypothetical protein